MNKLLYRKISLDIIYFFLVSTLSISLIIWVIQAVNYLDIVSEDGHSLKVYFAYSLLSLPKIMSRIMIFIFFVSCFYIINKYEENNEILVFWSNGIKKISLINFLLKFSILFLIIQLLLSLYIVPYTQNLGRIFIKNSNVDFLPSLITEKKFINVFKNLTIFLDEYDYSGNITNIYINEKLDNNTSKIIIAENGKIQKNGNNFLIKLFNGSIINTNDENFYNISFRETEYDLSKFSSKSVTVQKIQQINTNVLLNCFFEFYFSKNFNKIKCGNREVKSVIDELYKRLVIPFYIFILSLTASSLLIKPKSNKYLKFYKTFIFIVGFLFIIISQSGTKFLNQNIIIDILIITSPICYILLYYAGILLKTNFNSRYL